VLASILTTDPALPRRWNPRIPRDLEAIVVRATERNPRSRYATAAEMAEDLRAFAEDHAIRARRIGPLGRTWRRVRRHKVVAALAVLVLAFAALGITLSLKAAREEDQCREAEYRLLLTRAEQALVW